MGARRKPHETVPPFVLSLISRCTSMGYLDCVTFPRPSMHRPPVTMEELLPVRMEMTEHTKLLANQNSTWDTQASPLVRSVG